MLRGFHAFNKSSQKLKIPASFNWVYWTTEDTYVAQEKIVEFVRNRK
jgi:hypothetical protein